MNDNATRQLTLDNRFHAMVLFDQLDIPNTVVDARFLHRLVGYPDQDHNPDIDGMRPGGLGFLEDVRRPITWPEERRNQFDWRVDEGLDMNLFESIAERNGHPNWEARVEFLRLFRRGKFLSISRNTIEQISKRTAPSMSSNGCSHRTKMDRLVRES